MEDEAKYNEDRRKANQILENWNNAMTKRSEAREQRATNMFFGPVGLEESMSMHRDDIDALLWFMTRTLEKISELEARLDDK